MHDVGMVRRRSGLVRAVARMIVTCARCGHPVDRLTQRRDHARMGEVFTAYCHGEAEETFIGDMNLEYGPIKIEDGVAFLLTNQSGLIR